MSDLREKLKRLVKEADVYVFDTYSNAQKLPWQHVEENCRQAMVALKKLAALLAESEPEPCPERPGCGRDHGGGSWNANCTDCEAKAKLPLGHEFVESTEPLMRGGVRLMGGSRCKLCGRKRDAHGGLPLGHTFVPCDCLPRFKECQLFVKDDRCHEGFSAFCGQPRSAHEPK